MTLLASEAIAKSSPSKRADNKANVLGVGVVITSMTQVLDKIDQAVHSSLEKPFFIVTAYSETILEARCDFGFKQTLGKADLIVADGVSVLSAIDYQNRARGNILAKFWEGLRVGRDILAGKYAGRIVGVRLFEKLLSSNYRVYLLGGWGDVAKRLATKYGTEFDPGPVNISGASEVENKRVIIKINKYAPDILFVSFGRFRQEVWIADNLDKLRAKVIIGVGSAFDEVANKWQVPLWVERSGLKWLWRMWGDPGHIKRVWNAFPVFAWKVFIDKLRAGDEL